MPSVGTVVWSRKSIILIDEFERFDIALLPNDVIEGGMYKYDNVAAVVGTGTYRLRKLAGIDVIVVGSVSSLSIKRFSNAFVSTVEYVFAGNTNF